MGIAESALSFVRVVPEAPGGRSPGALLFLALILSYGSVQGLSPSWLMMLTARRNHPRCHRSGRNTPADGESGMPQWECDGAGGPAFLAASFPSCDDTRFFWHAL